MKHEIIITQDGSSSIYIPELDETYHSKFGAIQEAKHVFIKNGLDLFEDSSEISILEIGFGTGLNALITMLEAEKRNLKINYVGVEAYPIALDEIAQLNYVAQLEALDKKADFEKMHTANWEEEIQINSDFKLTKRKLSFADISDENTFDLIYFDAFGFTVQPELWNEVIFEIMYKSLKNRGILTTYACRTSIKNAMQHAGFQTFKLPGAPGKREMLRALKNW
ncbi:tRNA (5-methylaminomethyl-2-thiouridine)(34)-methyltransferase MnmD [Flavobacterium sp. F372]|uniref:tRNA (5-methylaminomethyl-2-thiouridine)(34)-methyltransferase MnmD n=1 Tax=Flavobacterium bernardetii TaxID=2813823 RepID=A0ABR7J2Y9_9FLAO|nr:tRNA (5-methylaminomethyl-2-thiouridine)(34)-methyltransferase MnmD [Flavobacterium bernardetii]MBC5836209.1 tRNA (5-methylaminomethyl-2-thiouridine)(34)-methyltransferase MnmD [Flavobacterium bernardetii]NHF71435.1 tRNA (5-methylaminomethyl-2-thiouridine)(34)-methyltransferase MnmD [Flavobacterium bernardetii]